VTFVGVVVFAKVDRCHWNSSTVGRICKLAACNKRRLASHSVNNGKVKCSVCVVSVRDVFCSILRCVWLVISPSFAILMTLPAVDTHLLAALDVMIFKLLSLMLLFVLFASSARC
jgi:hypothetical protein